MALSDIFTLVFTTVGVFFFLAGTVGLLRFPDVLSCLHALTKVDNPGLGFIIVGLIPQMNSVFDSLQLILIWFLVIASSVVCSFHLARYELDTSLEQDHVN